MTDKRTLEQVMHAWRNKERETLRPEATAVGRVFETDAQAQAKEGWHFLSPALLLKQEAHLAAYVSLASSSKLLYPGMQGDDCFLFLKRIKMTGDGSGPGHLGRSAAMQAQVQKRLSHENILPCLSVFSVPSQDHVFLMLPLVPVSLRAVVAKNVREQEGIPWDQKEYLSLAFVARLVQGIATGLDYLHTTVGISHGDVRLEHVLVPRLPQGSLTNHHPKLCDFSCSRTTTDANGHPIVYRSVLAKKLIANEAPGNLFFKCLLLLTN